MPTRINGLPLRLEKAAGTTSGPSRGLWLGTVASGVTHLAGGLLLGSVWGTALVQLVPPPYGTNAIQLTATQMVTFDATLDDDSEQTIRPATLGIETSDEATASFPRAPRKIRPDIGEMPPAPLIIERIDQAVAALARGIEQPSPLAVTTPPMKRLPDARRIIEPTSTPVLKKSAAPQPPVTANTAADPALPSKRQQGQDAESSPRKVSSPAPVYPAAALRQGITGRVVLRVKVDADGTVAAASVLQSSGHAILDEAALAGVRQWRFQPARQLGVAVEKEIAVPITFRIDRSP